MTTVAFSNVAGQVRGTPFPLPPARPRRLSTVVKRHAPKERPYIVSLHRATDPVFLPTNDTVRLRRQWKDTLVGRDDVVLITILPLGGGGKRAGTGTGAGRHGGKGALGIGLAVASIALIALAPVIVGPALLGLTGFTATAVQAGLVIGGVALGYAAQRSRAAGAASATSPTQQGTQVYSLSGGGNLPRPGARKPLFYGRAWVQPPLSQPDVLFYDNDAQGLVKRMTLGLGKYQVHRIRVGDAEFWNETTGIQPPFNGSGGGGGGTFAAAPAVELLYQQPSTIAPGDILSSPDVFGIELPRPADNPSQTPWHRCAPLGNTYSTIELDLQFPRGIYGQTAQGGPADAQGRIIFKARPINPVTGDVVGAEFVLFDYFTPLVLKPSAVRRTVFPQVPLGAYEVSARNALAFDANVTNDASWDGLRAHIPDTRVRPLTSEIVMRARAGPGLSVTAFSDVMVEATKIVPVWNGSAWVEQATRKAVWAYADLVRAPYGLNDNNGVDTARLLHYASTLTEHDEYNGPLPDVSSFWQAGSDVLAPIRCQPIKVGRIHSFVRDESHASPRHVLTRRQIVRDSAQATYTLATQDGTGDVVVEFDRDGDPKKPDEVRATYGSPSRTAKRYKVTGITTGEHAMAHARYLAAIAAVRGDEREVTTEWDGRLIYPGDQILSDVWFLKGKQVVGVSGQDGAGFSGGPLLALDAPTSDLVDGAWTYASIRSRNGREWGLLRVTSQGQRAIELHPDDVADLASSTSLSLGDVLATDGQDPTTIAIGELAELQRTYVARSAVPSGPDQVRIEMVGDDPRVWAFLDEPIVVPSPPEVVDPGEPEKPDDIVSLVARCERIETGIEVRWGLSPPRGGRTYLVELSYDGVTREMLQFDSHISGRKTIHQSPNPVWIYARAYGRSGLPSEEIATSFSTQPPVVQGGLIAPGSIVEEQLDAAISAILTGSGPGTVNEARTLAQEAIDDTYRRFSDLRTALSANPEIRKAVIDPVLRGLRSEMDTLSEALGSLQEQIARHRSELIEAGLEINSSEGKARIFGIASLAQETGQRFSTVEVSLDALQGQIDLIATVGQTGDLSGLIQSISTVEVELDALNASLTNYATKAELTSESARVSTVETRLSAAEGAITDRATVTQFNSLGTRTTTVEQRLDATQGSFSTIVLANQSSLVDLPMTMEALGLTLGILQSRLDHALQNLSFARQNFGARLTETGEAIAFYSLDLAAFKANTAAQFQEEINIRAAADASEATARTTLASQVNDPVTGLVATRSKVTQLDQAVNTPTTGIASRLTTLQSQVNDPTTGLSATRSTVTQLDQAVNTPTTGLASRVSSLSTEIANARSGSATLSAALDVIDQARIDGDTALSTSITAVSVRANAATASGRMTLAAVTAPGGVASRFAVQLNASPDSATKYSTGFYLDLLPSGAGRILFDVDQFLVTNGATTKIPFQIDSNGRTVITDLLVTRSFIAPDTLTSSDDWSLPQTNNVGGSSSLADVPFSPRTFTCDATSRILVYGYVGATLSNSPSAPAIEMYLYIDGIQIPPVVGAWIAGNDNYQYFMRAFSVGPGSHTIKLMFRQSTTGSGGQWNLKPSDLHYFNFTR